MNDIRIGNLDKMVGISIAPLCPTAPAWEPETGVTVDVAEDGQTGDVISDDDFVGSARVKITGTDEEGNAKESFLDVTVVAGSVLPEGETEFQVTLGTIVRK